MKSNPLELLEYNCDQFALQGMLAHLTLVTTLNDAYILRIHEEIKRIYQDCNQSEQVEAICHDTIDICVAIDKQKLTVRAYWYFMECLENIKERVCKNAKG